LFVIVSDREADGRVGERVISHLSPSSRVRLACIEPSADEESVLLTISSDIRPDGIHVRVVMSPSDGESRAVDDFDTSILDSRFTTEDWERRRNERIRRAIVNLMVPDFASRDAIFWGILFGVRPTKVIHRLIDKGFNSDEIRHILCGNFLLSPDKANLVVDVANLQRQYLLTPDQARHTVGIYLGVPFCPTRCHYCSFAAYPMRTHAHLVKGFMSALLKEISDTADILDRHGLDIQSIYVGGGTPSSLGPERVSEILTHLSDKFRLKERREHMEFTFEAGRPDTITQPLLDSLKSAGVNRISINPQTMNKQTLELIGRAHTPDDVIKAMKIAKPMDFESINMDIILGLPGESQHEVNKTLRSIADMAPDNVTVHTLSMKHAAKWRQNINLYQFPSDDEVVGMLEQSKSAVVAMGMHAYYLYRQRFIAADLENVGYSLPGLESTYNIQMMEERMTVIGLGGGGVTKMVDPSNWELTRHFNPKCPATFNNKYDELVSPKFQMLDEFLDRTK
jgi:oxygen-independent coproporphyrinogen-3 oxidase